MFNYFFIKHLLSFCDLLGAGGAALKTNLILAPGHRQREHRLLADTGDKLLPMRKASSTHKLQDRSVAAGGERFHMPLTGITQSM